MKTFLLLSSLVLPVWSLASPQCQYKVLEKETTVEWKAFKTTQRVDVKGTLNRVTIQQSLEPRKNLGSALQGLEFKIRIMTPDHLKTGNPGRDLTLIRHFFSQVPLNSEIKGKVVKASFKKKYAEIEFDWGNKKYRTPIRLSLKGHQITGKGKIDLIKMGLEAPYNALHKECKDLHKGKDGVSKTWSEVEIQVQTRFTKKCR